MAERQADDSSHGQGTALKRRGILAAAGAVVAGIVAKQAAAPVAAAFTLQGDFDNASTAYTNIHGPGAAPPWTSAIPVLPLLSVNNTTPGHDGLAALTTGGGHGVYGQTDSGIGQFGRATGSGTGVYGSSISGTGVFGTSPSGDGVYGQSMSSHGVFGVAGLAGTTSITAGVYGFSGATYGVIGSTTASGYSGLTAITNTAGVAALAATSTNASAYAAYFQGTTVVQGNFVAFAGSKSAAVKDASGQHRLVYCVESPEAWFEDFGTATLVNGNATVTLDKTFTEIVHTDDYHVFLTAHADTNGLHVTRREAGAFAVREHRGGTSSLTFSWRVVAKRKDITGERLAKFAPPQIKHPDPDKLPKPEPIPPSPPPRTP